MLVLMLSLLWASFTITLLRPWQRWAAACAACTPIQGARPAAGAAATWPAGDSPPAAAAAVHDSIHALHRCAACWPRGQCWTTTGMPMHTALWLHASNKIESLSWNMLVRSNPHQTMSRLCYIHSLKDTKFRVHVPFKQWQWVRCMQGDKSVVILCTTVI